MGQIVSVQVLRLLAALAVVFLHVSHDAQTIAERTGSGFVPMWGPFDVGVDLFFVISGFVMVVSSSRLFGQAGAVRLFFARRFARIVPIYWATTSLYVILALFVPALLNANRIGGLEVIESYLFVPFAQADGSIVPVFKQGWTLNYEMLFYLVFALMLGCFRSAQRVVVGITVVFGVLAVVGWFARFSPGPFQFWTATMPLEFVAGCWIGMSFVGGVRLPWGIGGLIAAAGIGLAVPPMLFGLHYEPTNTFLRAFVWGVPAALILLGGALGFPQRQSQSRLTRTLVGLGDASYALYICHPFIVRLFREVWIRLGLASRFNEWFYILIATVVSVLAAMLIHRFFEQPLTRWVQHRLGVKRSPSSTLSAVRSSPST